MNLHLQINSNGYLVFGPETLLHDGRIHSLFPSENQIPLIALYNSDIDFTEYSEGFISYRLDATPDILAQATDIVMGIRQYAQELPNFQATWTLIVTWHDAVFYGAASTKPRVVSFKIMHNAHVCGRRSVFLISLNYLPS